MLRALREFLKFRSEHSEEQMSCAKAWKTTRTNCQFVVFSSIFYNAVTKNLNVLEFYRLVVFHLLTYIHTYFICKKQVGSDSKRADVDLLNLIIQLNPTI